MEFKKAPRVIYNKSPLNEVVCQLRFRPILKIDTTPPSEFQEMIGDVFPVLTGENQQFFTPSELVSNPIQGQEGQGVPGGKRNYKFSSEDGVWVVNLTSSFIALTCTKYDRWENFREKCSFVFEAFYAIYKPANFTRIGLRYINVIRRSILGLENEKWSGLIMPYISGIAGTEIEPERIIGSFSSTEVIFIEAHCIVRINSGLADITPENEKAFIIDCDYFVEGKWELNAIFNKLDTFNRTGRDLFRWCITEKLHQAMEPQNVM